MPEPVTINPQEPLNKGLDYAYLKEEGVRLVQQMSGEIWTDYNESDPGVTTLEQLCYALTELSYRAEFPLKDLLLAGPPPADRIDPDRQALFIPKRIFPGNPLTINDYRKLIVDQIPEVANAWLTCRSPKESNGINGLYRIELYVPDANADADADDDVSEDEINPHSIRARTRRVYNRHRNLCEDVDAVDIRILKPLPVAVHAEVSVDNTLTPEAILAGIFFRLGSFLAPELRREPLNLLLERGETTDEIFNGPLLHNGLINSEQLRPKAKEISIQQLIKVIMQSPGVTSARGVQVCGHGENPIGETIAEDQSWQVPKGKILQLDTNPGRTGYTIRLRRNGIELQPNVTRVQRELDKLWAKHRRTYKLSAQYEQFLAVPRGKYHDVQQYYSVQNQFPNVYGINENGLPSGVTRTRQAQAKQFKGYLLVFEQLLANYFAQLAHAKDLYSIDRVSDATYFYQYLLKSVPNIEPLLINNEKHYKAGVRRIVRSQDPAVERRNRFLDFLLAMYAESMDASSVWFSSQQRDGDRLIEAKRAMLQQLVESTANRSRGFDYLAISSPLNTSGMAIKSRIQLGMSPFEHPGLCSALDQHSLKLVRSTSDVSIDQTLSGHIDHIEEQFLPLASWVREREITCEPTLSQATFKGQTITENHVHAAAANENFYVGKLPGHAEVVLACMLPKGGWWLVGKYPDDKNVAASVRASVEYLHRHCRQLYIVEHNLLRSRTHCNDHDDEFVYNFTITAVVTDSPGENKTEYQKFAREVIRQNTPAHIAVGYCCLYPYLMCVFERLYIEWRHALRGRGDIDSTSRELREFLQHHWSKQP